jgi:AraC-like DNA-binding protein
MRVATADDFAREPVGRYVAGDSYLIWVDSPSLAGAAFFGRPDEREIPGMLRLSSLREQWAHPGYDVLIDCSELEPMDTASFTTLRRHVHDVAPVTTKLRAVSIIRPPGVAGAIIGGLFHDSVQPKFRAALFADRAEGFAWLGRADSADEYARLDELMKLRGAPPPLRALRDHLAHDPVGATLAGAARTLALSERSLSRRLSELGTSFRNEVQRARLRIAEGLLVDTDLKLDAVARKVGFTSRTHFSDFFHRATGETPSDFRARRR